MFLTRKRRPALDVNQNSSEAEAFYVLVQKQMERKGRAGGEREETRLDGIRVTGGPARLPGRFLSRLGRECA